MPKISVVVPVYKTEKYLDRCIESILSQTYENFELILVDDGSPDRCGEICDNYAAKDNRIKAIHKQNGGVSAARNDGILAANGEYIMFVDSDDYIDSKMLDVMLKETTRNADLIISSTKMIYKNAIYNFVMDSRVYSPKEIFEDFCLQKFPKICLCGPCCKIYKRDIIIGNSIFFNTSMKLGEDTDFNLQYLNAIDTVVTIKDELYYYMRDNEESLFTKFRSNYYNDTKMVNKNEVILAKKLGCSQQATQCLEQKYVYMLFSNLVKAVITSDKKDSIEYMKNIKDDENLNNNFELIKSKKSYYVTIIAIKFGLFELVYYSLLLRYKFLRK